MMEQVEWRYIQDPGHGWIEVSKMLVDALGISDKVSSYSYSKGELVYLEEDCDAPLFIRTFESKYPSTKITLKELHLNGSSPIRNYKAFK